MSQELPAVLQLEELDPAEILFASILACPDVLHLARERLLEQDFPSTPQRWFWRCLCELSDAGTEISMQTVAVWMRDHDAAGMVPAHYIAGLDLLTPDHAQNIDPYVESIVDRSRLRSTSAKASEIVASAARYTGDVQTFIERAIDALKAISDRQPHRSLKTVKAALAEKFENWNLAAKGLKNVEPIATGFPDLDMLLGGGMKPGKTYVLAARPKRGKTALALNIATTAAGNGVATFFGSTEMPREEITDRQLSFLSGVPFDRVSRPSLLTPEDHSAIAGATAFLEKYPLWIDDNPEQSMLAVAAKCARIDREIKRKGGAGLGLAVIDSLQNIPEPHGSRDRYDATSRNSKAVKALSTKMSIPILLICHMNRAIEYRGGKPALSDLGESGRIERDHDSILFLHKPKRKPGELVNDDVELIVAAQRSGAPGVVDLAFNRRLTRFEPRCSLPGSTKTIAEKQHWADN